MIRSVCLKIFLLYFVIGFVLLSDVHNHRQLNINDDQPGLKVKNGNPVRQIPSTLPSGNFGGKKTVITKINENSNLVNSDGSFEFKSFRPDVTIHIFGELKEVNGTKKLAMRGTYKFKSFGVNFRANEMGFHVAPTITSAQLSQNTIISILG